MLADFTTHVEVTITLFGILTSVRTADELLTLHEEKMTWSNARGVCLQDGGTLIPDSSQQNIADLMANVRTPVWEGRYYSPWAWLLGCYSYQGSLDYTEIKDNQMKECVNHCHNTNYFGLKNKTCFCFDKFEGSSLRTIDNCKYACPGNEDETCGGNNAITMYMNDICYTNSSQWQGTVSQTWSGKQCLPWTSIAEVNSTDVLHFPDGNAGNASNFCTDPFNQSKLKCYISQDKQERCNIPPCIEAANDGNHSCMSFKKPSYGDFEFMQESCQSANYAFCTWDNHYFWRLVKGTWQYARHQSRQHYNKGPVQTSKCKTLAGPEIFLLRRKDDVKFFHWFGYFREICTSSTTVPNRIPQKCFSLSKEYIDLIPRVEDCDNKNAFICQYVHVPPMPTSETSATQISDTSTQQNLSGAVDIGDNALLVGAFAGMTGGIVLVVGLVLGIAVFLIRRKINNTVPDPKRRQMNSTPNFPDSYIIDTGIRTSSEIYQNTNYYAPNARESTQYVYSDTTYGTAGEMTVMMNRINVSYLKQNDNNADDPRAEDMSEIYNTLNESTENHYQNLTSENVYNSFSDSNELYDHTTTSCQSTAGAMMAGAMVADVMTADAMVAPDMQTYDNMTGDNYTFAHMSTMQMEQNTATEL